MYFNVNLKLLTMLINSEFVYLCVCVCVNYVYFLNIICHNSDMFRYILINFMELLNINRFIYINLDVLLSTLNVFKWNALKIIKFACSCWEMDHKIWRVKYYRFLQMFISVGCLEMLYSGNLKFQNFHFLRTNSALKQRIS